MTTGSTHRGAGQGIKHAAAHSYLRRARNAAGSTSGSSISVDVVAMPPLNMASNTALPTARANLRRATGAGCKYGHLRIKYGFILAETKAIAHMHRAEEFAISLVHCNIQNESKMTPVQHRNRPPFIPTCALECAALPFPSQPKNGRHLALRC